MRLHALNVANAAFAEDATPSLALAGLGLSASPDARNRVVIWPKLLKARENINLLLWIRFQPVPQIHEKDFFDGKVLFGPDSIVPVHFRENNLNFQVDVVNGQKTGFFLDQRENRLQIKQISKGLSVLNVFSYTGGFSIYAISGGCKKLLEIDSNTWALKSSKQNLKLNFNETCNFGYQQIKGDAFKKLKEFSA